MKLLSKKVNSPPIDSSNNINTYSSSNNNTHSNNIYTKKVNNLIMDSSFSNLNKNENVTNSNIDQRPYSNLKLLSNNDVEEELRKAYELELKKLRDNKTNELDLINNNKDKDLTISKLHSKIESLNTFLVEEKTKNAQLLVKIKSLEDSFKALNSEYMSLNYRFNKAQTDSENYEKSLLDVRKNNTETKGKFEELVRVNSELKNRLVDYENTAKLHQDDLKNLLKRNSNLQKNLEVNKYT